MRKVMYIGQEYSVIEIDGEMKVSWAEGIERKIVYHDISEELFERLKRSEEDTKAVIREIQYRDRITMDLQTLKEMQLAIREKRVDDFRRLANENPDTFDVNAPWATFLHDAATYGSYGIAEYLIECGVNVNKRAGFRYCTALPYAAYGGCLDIVRLLYENGCRIHMDYALENPLFAAISGGHLDVVKYLVEKGIDLSKTYSLNGGDIDAIAYAKSNGKTEIYTYLENVINKETLREIRVALQQNRVDDFIKLVNENRYALDVETPLGTLLHDAAAFGKYDIAKYLIECGMDVNKKCGLHNATALTHAAFEGDLDIVKLLYDNGARFYVDTFDENPLFAAIYGRHFEVVKFLVEKGIDLSPEYKIFGKQLDCCGYAGYYAKTKILSYLNEKLGRPPAEQDEPKKPEVTEADLSKKPEFDYAAFEEKLLAEMRNALKKYSDRKDIYAFSIRYQPEFTTYVAIWANSYTYLNECTKSERADFNYYKYFEEEWEITEDLNELSDDLIRHYDLVEKWCGEDDDLYEEMYDDHKYRIVDSCVNVLQKLKLTEEFSLYPKLNLNVYLYDALTEEEYCEIYRKLNDEQAVKEYEQSLLG